jgi:phage shock protein C
MNRRLYRCRQDQRIAGVAGGMAEYFDLDPSLVRILWILSVFLGGVGLLLYIAMALVVPLEPEVGVAPAGAQATGAPAAGAQTADPTGATGEAGVPSPIGWHSAPAGHRHATRGGGRGDGRATTIFGVVLILFGTLALLDRLLPDWADGGRFLGPAFIVGIGILLVASAVRREPTKPTEPTEPTGS